MFVKKKTVFEGFKYDIKSKNVNMGLEPWLTFEKQTWILKNSEGVRTVFLFNPYFPTLLELEGKNTAIKVARQLIVIGLK